MASDGVGEIYVAEPADVTLQFAASREDGEGGNHTFTKSYNLLSALGSESLPVSELVNEWTLSNPPSESCATAIGGERRPPSTESCGAAEPSPLHPPLPFFSSSPPNSSTTGEAPALAAELSTIQDSPDLSALAVEYPHVSHVVLVPTLRVGSQIMTVNQKLPGLLHSLLKQLMNGTRVWIKDEVLAWLRRADDSETCRMFVILGSAGTGKSVISAMLVDQLLLRDVNVGAVHFCRFDDPVASGPDLLLSSLAAQLATSVPGFGGAIIEADVEAARERGDVDLLFEAILAAPIRSALAASGVEGRDIVLLFDALDELPPSALVVILNLLRSKFVALPARIKLIVTAREQDDIKKALDKFKPVPLLVDELHNRQDIRKFLSLIAAGCVELTMTMQDVAEKVADKWKGIDVAQLSALEGPLQSSKLCYGVAVDRIAREPGYKRLCGIQEVRPEPPLEQTIVGGIVGRDRDEVFRILMTDAGDARLFLRGLFADAWEPKHDKPTMHVPVPGTARPWVENAIDPGLKGEARAKQKADLDYGGNRLALKDLARKSLEFTCCEKMYVSFEELKKLPGVEIVGVKNKFANPTPMGYRDLNLSVRVTLPDGRKHICEVQLNLVDMLKAKHEAHKDYEEVRSRLPAICISAGGGAKADDVEAFVMRLLQSSVLDSAVKSLEEKAGGLFIYSRLLEAQLKEMQRETGGKRVDFAKLGALPSGLREMYECNFQRTFSTVGTWELCKEIVAMISVAREPLPETLVGKIVGEGEYCAAKSAMSLLFPVREGRLHVMHKSVVDWLTEVGRAGQWFWISTEDKSKANATLAVQLWGYEGWRCCGVGVSWDYEMDEGEKYAVTYGHVHFKNALVGCEGRTNDVAREWVDALLQRRTETDLSKSPFGRVMPAFHSGGTSSGIQISPSTRSKSPQESLRHRLQRWVLSVFRALLCDSCRKEELEGSVPQESRAASLGVTSDEDSEPQVGEKKKYQLCLETATAAGGLLIMRQAKMGRIKKFTAELRELLVQLVELKEEGANCQTQQLRRLIEDEVAALGARFNPIFRDIENTCFEGAASDMFSNVPMTSPLNHSAAATAMCFLKPGIFAYNMTLPHRVGNSPIIMELNGHSDAVWAVAFSRDGSRIASGSGDKTVKIWNAATGEVENTLNGHSGVVRSVAFSHDGSRIVSGSDDKTVKIWNASTGEVENTLNGHSGPVTSVASSHDGSRIVSGSNDKTVKIWNAATGEAENTLNGHSDIVRSVALSHDGSRIASGSWDKSVKIWNTATGKVENTLNGHSATVRSVAFSRDGSRIVSGSWDKTIKIWNAATGEEENTLDGHSDWVTAVAFNREGSRIVSGSDDKTVKIWNAATGKVESTLNGHSDTVRSVAFNREGSRIVSGSDDKTVKIWNAATGDVENTLNGHSDVVRSVAFNRDGSRIASGSDDKTVKIWNASTGEVENTLNGHLKFVTSVAFSHNGSRIASGSGDKTVKIWNASTGDVDNTLNGHSDRVTSVAFNHDGSRIASGSWDKTIKIWNAATGKVKNTLNGHSEYVTSVAFSNDGSRIVSGSGDKTVKIWNAARGKVKNTLNGHSDVVRSVDFNRDGSRIVSGSWDKTIKIWNSSTGEVENTLNGHSDWVAWVAFNHDGSRIASGSDDKTIKIWNAATGKVENTLNGHSEYVTSVAFNHDGSRIASGSDDKTAKIWNAATSEVVTP